ncbi:MAG: diguanylate cyclase [Thermoleophilaceae bacterium]|nr:diguanylate cyclase [Thermoleophilaceae bacterium]
MGPKTNPRIVVLEHVLIATAAGLIAWGLRALSPPVPTLAVFVFVLTFAILTLMHERYERALIVLREAARTDPLTGLLNRRGLDRVFRRELARARRSGEPLAVLLGDIDHFKQVNDTFGHAAGDETLKVVAGALERGVREVDVVARFGGEEFAVLLPGQDERGAYDLAERLRTEVADASKNGSETVTISFGIAAFPLHAGTASGLLSAADAALYHGAKRLGRNAAAVYDAATTEMLSAGDELSGELATAIAIAEQIDARDTGSMEHSRRVGRIAERLAEELGLAEHEQERLRLAGRVHDVGKIAVPEEVRQKSGPLDEAEWEQMREHPETRWEAAGG